MLELRKGKSTDYVLSWKWNGVYNSKLKAIYTTFIHSIKFPGYKIEIEFGKYRLALEQNNYYCLWFSCFAKKPYK